MALGVAWGVLIDVAAVGDAVRWLPRDRTLPIPFDIFILLLPLTFVTSGSCVGIVVVVDITFADMAIACDGNDVMDDDDRWAGATIGGNIPLPDDTNSFTLLLPLPLPSLIIVDDNDDEGGTTTLV
jgi:hypothetical protein